MQNDKYLQYILFFSPYKRTRANPVCSLLNSCSPYQESFPLWQWTFCLQADSGKALTRVIKDLIILFFFFFKCHCITASHYSCSTNLPSFLIKTFISISTLQNTAFASNFSTWHFGIFYPPSITWHYTEQSVPLSGH